MPDKTKKTLYLHLNHDKDFVWLKVKNLPPAVEKAARPPVSRLDFTVKNNMEVSLKLGDSLKTWKFWEKTRPASQSFPNPSPIEIQGRVPGPTRGPHEGIFDITLNAELTTLIVHHIDSEKNPGSWSDRGVFKFDLHLLNISSDTAQTKVTGVTIDPIIVNDGAGEDP